MIGAYFPYAPPPMPMEGVGQFDMDRGTVTALGIVAIAAVGVSGYVAGKAMAPRGRETAYSWGGAALGLVLGPIGLGILGAVALSAR